MSTSPHSTSFLSRLWIAAPVVLVLSALSPATTSASASSASSASAETMVVLFEEDASLAAVGRAASIGDDPALLARDVPGDTGAAIRVELTPGEASRVRALVGVDAVFADAPVAVADYSWGLDRIDETSRSLDRSSLPSGLGAGSTIYVIDTGVSPVSELPVLLPGRNFVRDVDPNGFDLGLDPSRTADCNGHGTHVATLAAGDVHGVADAASVVPLRVLGCDGYGWLSDVIAALSWVGERHVPGSRSVVNMSLAGAAYAPLNAAVDALTARGVVVVAAAGNDSSDACSYSPAGAQSALTVAASDASDRLAVFSNFGSCVDLVAPGVSLPASTPSGIAYLSGTSMAAPLVAGVAAAMWSASPWVSAAQLTSAVVSSATPGAVGNASSLLTTDRLLHLNLSSLPAPSPAPTPAFGVGHGFVPITSQRMIDTRPSRVRVDHREVVVDLASVPRPADGSAVKAVALNVTVTDTKIGWGGGFVSVRPCGMPVSTSLLNFADNEIRAGSGVFAVPPSGLFCVYVYGSAHVIVDVFGWHVDRGTARFEVVAPVRVADSRAGLALRGRLPDRSVSRVDLRPALRNAGVDPAQVSAVWANLTVVDGRAGATGGFLSAGPCPSGPGNSLEHTSTVNFVSGQTVANGGLFPITDGMLCVYAFGSADVIVDVSGIETGAPARPAPVRMLDTRQPGAPSFSPGGELVVVSGATSPTSFVVNVTAVGAGKAGFLSIGSCERGRPSTSNLNFAAGVAVANAAIVDVGSSGRLCVWASTPVQVIIDRTAVLG